jgi:hypothetical protein
MRHREWIALCWTVAGMILLLTAAPVSLAAPNDAMYAKCAKVCKDCMQACKACNTHCAGMVKSGKKEHEKSLKLSADCRDICALAATICERKGPMTAAICEACRIACDACGKECQKYPNMKPMADCAKSCAVCSKACQEMIAALK